MALRAKIAVGDSAPPLRVATAGPAPAFPASRARRKLEGHEIEIAQEEEAEQPDRGHEFRCRACRLAKRGHDGDQAEQAQHGDDDDDVEQERAGALACVAEAQA